MADELPNKSRVPYASSSKPNVKTADCLFADENGKVISPDGNPQTDDEVKNRYFGKTPMPTYDKTQDKAYPLSPSMTPARIFTEPGRKF